MAPLVLTARWRRIAKAQLKAEPPCGMCLLKLTPATVCDHMKPHRGDPDLFWNGERQSLCKPHQSSTKQRQENRGYVVGSDTAG
jgi:hypothetical protein